MNSDNWMIYGAYGYTGVLVVEEAIRRGHKPVLAGRSADRLVPLAERLGLAWVVVDLRDEEKLSKTVQEFDLVFHAAGPFGQTCDPMVRACLNVGTNYVDMSAEIPVFEHVLSLDQRARQRGIVLIPGLAFAVIATDCLARYVAEQIDRPTLLEMATVTSITSEPSPGTAKTAFDTLAGGILARREGKLVRISPRQEMRRIRFIDRERTVLPVTLGDLSTAYRTTGIPNITTYIAFPEGEARRFSRFEPIYRNLFGIAPLRRLAQKQAEKSVRGPDEHMRRTERSYVWVYARNEEGVEGEAWLETLESYLFTAVAGVRYVEKVLAERPQGALTPALAFGADSVLEVPGTRRVDYLENIKAS